MKFLPAFGLLCFTAMSYRAALPARQAADLSHAAIAVTDQVGTPVPNAEVRLDPMPQSVDNIFTDTKGELQLAIPAGNYELSVTAAGFMTAREHMELGIGINRNVDVVLKIGASCPPGCPAFIAGPLQSYAATMSAITIKKRSDSRSSRSPSVNVSAGGRVVLQNTTLRDLIAFAYNVHPWQISGGEDWTRKTVFDIEAELPETTQLKPMLSSLLTERFQLQFHWETKTGTVYLLRRNPQTFRLRPAKVTPPGHQEISRVDGDWVLADTTLPKLAEFTSDFIVHARVIDITGLTGAFDFRSDVSETQSTAKDKSRANIVSFLSALDEMGLNLKTCTGPVDFFAINRATKPSPN